MNSGDKIMSREHRDEIMFQLAPLLENVQLSKVIQDLQSRDVLSSSQVDLIKSKSTDKEMSNCLLDVITRRPDHVYSNFISAVNKEINFYNITREGR